MTERQVVNLLLNVIWLGLGLQFALALYARHTRGRFRRVSLRTSRGPVAPLPYYLLYAVTPLAGLIFLLVTASRWSEPRLCAIAVAGLVLVAFTVNFICESLAYRNRHPSTA